MLPPSVVRRTCGCNHPGHDVKLPALKGLEMPKEIYWIGSDIGPKDDFGFPIDGEFIDGKTRFGPWAIMSPSAWKNNGVGKLGTGYGQRYKKQEDGRWLKVEG